MKNNKIYIAIGIITLTYMLFNQNIQAQQNIAQQAYAIFEQSCVTCHGQEGSFKEALLIEYTALIDGGTVVPGNPEGSVLYQRLIETNEALRMPLNQPPLSAEAIETIRQWIVAGAPDWKTIPRQEAEFISNAMILETIQSHINTLSMRDREYARYFTLTHLYNAGETTETLHEYRLALSKLVNSLSWGREVVNPKAIDTANTIFYIDLRDYEWDVRNDAWAQIEQMYPYKMVFDASIQTNLREKLITLQQETSSEVPFIHVDWFLATASLPPLYHAILDLPETVGELETRLEVYVAENLKNAPGKRVWRAGFNDSGVSQHNRVVERHISRYGAYWKSYDFAGSAEAQNIFTHPLDFIHDGGEIIYNLPNGLQAYYLVDAAGNRLDVAPTDIVSNPAASDPAVRNGLSCIGCHTEGMKTFKDQVRAVAERAENPSYDKVQVLDLYVEKTVMDTHVVEDTKRFQEALEKIGDFGDIEPVQRFHEVFQKPLDATQAAASVGFETVVFLDKISKNATLQNLLGSLSIVNGTIKRDAWTSNFDQVISVLNTPDSVSPPVVEPNPGESVHIPDPNLRAALEAELSKTEGEMITVGDMATLTYLNVSNYGKQQRINIKNLKGLEFAIKLNHLNIGLNAISDLSPLAGLTNIHFLDVANNLVSDITPLESLTRLTNLVLTENLITDLSPLANLTNLEALRVNRNLVTDFSPIIHLTSLKEVWIANSTLSDLSLFEGLINLEGIHAWDVPIEDLSPLTGLTKLRWLNFGRTQVSELAPLVDLTNLRKLTFYDCVIEDISDLERLTELVHIKMPHNMISDLSPLEGLIHLSYLELGDNGISDISPLENLINLETLWIGHNNVADVSPLTKLTNLKELNIRDNPITDFSPLAELFENTKILFDVIIPDVNLRSAIVEALGKEDADNLPITLEEVVTLTILRAKNRDIQDLTGIEHAINLEEMWISGNPVSDLSPLAELTNFIGLHAWETSITDLSPLVELTKLRWLDFGRTPVSDLSPLADIASLRKLTFYACDIKDISPLAGLTGLTYLAVGGNREISDASHVAGLVNLEFLDFHHDSISDLQPLAGLTKLKYLNLYNNKLIVDVSPLVGLTSLTSLHLGQNMISNVSHLSQLTNLTSLELPRNMLTDVSPLARLINLETLNLRDNSISDFSSLQKLSESTYIVMLNNPGSPIEGPTIEGPWLWMLVPDESLDNTTDLLAEASGGVVTAQYIATNGATEGNVVGDYEWTSHRISSKTNFHKIRNNMREVLHAFGLSENDETSDNVLYGCVLLNSPQEQETRMLVGSEGHHRIWLNGTLVYDNLRFRKYFDYNKYSAFFPVTLKQGVNILLVAVDRGHWITGHFGFEEGTEYTVLPPDIVTRLTFSTTETDLLAGDTFTLNLNAENITDLAGWEGDISYDPNVLEAVAVTEGDFLKTDATTFFQGGTIDNTTGKISNINIARIAGGGVNGSGTLLSIEFKTKAGGDTYITLENFEFGSSSGDIIPAVPPNITITIGEYPPWDVNQDGRVSILDLILVAQDLGSGTPANLRTDVNRDGTINIQDLILVAQHLGEATDSTASPIFTIDNKELMPEMIQAWIEQAKTENDGSITYQKGIRNLQKLLESLIPEKTALLTNYPNPFNPDTWIPYHLSKSAEVTLTIYAANGAVVRTLSLGQQNAGMYQVQSRAAHWDGKNENGESVASGIYFYTLTAGNFTATRKMLILK